ncbi:MAG: 2-oxoglutarate and iron-dependent oxygenase domain-containing protein [Cyanobacteria bacterium P01_A01_bin.15]
MTTVEPQSVSANIPIIDFSLFLTGSSKDRQQVAQEIFQACHQVGFLYLKNHGIPQTAIVQAFEQSHVFFGLSLAEKQRLAWSSAHSNQGYIGVEQERLDEAQPGDLKEAFNITQEFSLADSTTGYGPANCPLFHQTFAEFFALCAATAGQVFRAFACALALPDDYLIKRHQTNDYTLRLLHYPPLGVLPAPGQLRAGAHSDYGSLTLLFQDSVGGLEIQRTSGDWIAAPVVCDTILINIGDLMERWTNGVFRSTRHRVRLPQGVQAQDNSTSLGPGRNSIAFFCQPDADVDIVCLPTCSDDQNPPKYPPVKSGDYLLSRLQATH